MSNIIRETSITIDYDLNRVYVDTNRKGVASKLKHLGFEMLKHEKSDLGELFWRFTGVPRQISFRGVNKKVRNINEQSK